MSIGTQWESRIAELERLLSEACAAVQGYRLAFEEAQRKLADAEQQIEELTRPAVATEEDKAALLKAINDIGGDRGHPVRGKKHG